MTLKTVPLSALYPSKDNPRRQVSDGEIEQLATSIKADGVLQNLIVQEKERGKYCVISGSRRLLALKLLKRKGVIEASYKVPVEVRRIEAADALRIATVENVQRSDLEPIDEAEAFARMLQDGETIEDLSVKSGLSERTIRKRVALAGLCEEVKDAVRNKEVPLNLAESLTLGTHDQQRAILEDLRRGAEFDREAIRRMLCAQKPPLSFAIFSVDQYTGSFTRDLFGDEETTYFDDVDQFFALQKDAIERMADRYRKKAAWVDQFNSFVVPWWQYRDAKKGERAGIVINLHPSGKVEVKKSLARHKVRREVAEATKETPQVPRRDGNISAGLVRYAALQKSVAVQAALLRDARKAKELAVACLILGLLPSTRLRVDVHPCLTYWETTAEKPKGFEEVSNELRRLFGLFGADFDARFRVSMKGPSEDPELAVYEALQQLSDSELDRLSTVVVLLSFGQATIDSLDAGKGLFNKAATDLRMNMRDWWTPNLNFLSLLRRDQLERIAVDSGASLRLGPLKGYGKKELTDALAKYFARTADPAANVEDQENKARAWTPGVMSFPAQSCDSAVG